MIEYEKFLTFCSENDLTFEEFMLLYTLHLRNEQSSPDLHGKMADYYGQNKNDWSKMIESLEERGFLIIMGSKGKSGKYLLRNLKLEKNFVNLLFYNTDEVWERFVLRYPLFGAFGEGIFDAAIFKDRELDKEYFIKHILKNGDKNKADAIIADIERMFDWNGVKPRKPAKIGISRFIRNWDTYLRMFNEEEDKEEKLSRASTRL